METNSIQQIVQREWAMFSAVSNVGGPAGCQSEPVTFSVMRQSQISVWPEELQESYLADLTAAARAGRNLMSEKYAWMMENAFPDEFAAISPLLPVIDQETLDFIEDIVAVHVEWKIALNARYPRLSGRGRPVRTREDSAFESSFETYLRGELKSYSPRSVRILHRHTLEQQRGGINGGEAVLLEQARQYGYASLDEAEQGQYPNVPQYSAGNEV